ncbi:abortive infection family protein [Micromonospora sp. DPT]|uniref:abortive infection family protein n=1 Tax=Micromonospora sp. DPT TaxID=3142975 RepID=UPI00320985D6
MDPLLSPLTLEAIARLAGGSVNQKDVESAAKAVGLKFIPDNGSVGGGYRFPSAHEAIRRTLRGTDLSDPAQVARVLRFAARLAELYEAGPKAERHRLVRLRNCLSDDGYALDAPGDPLAAITGLAAAASVALADAAAIRQELVRLERALPDDTGALIGRAKNLIEATAKAVLALRGEPVNDNDEVPALVSKASQALGVHVTQAAGPQLEQVKRVLGRLHPLTHDVAELRNRAGDGHGMTGVPAVDAAVGRLAARSAIAWCAFMLEVAMSGSPPHA